MEPKKLIALVIGVLVAGALAVAILSSGCSGGNGQSKAKLPASPAKLDSMFRKENPSEASALKVFVECSASMDGYVTGNSEFKTTIHNIVNQTSAAILAPGAKTHFNYINSKTIPLEVASLREFTRSMSPQSFKTQSDLAGGDRSQSDLMEVMEAAIGQTANGEVSMLVSDCVFSLGKAADLDKALDQQRTDMTAAITKRLKTDPGFAVMAIRFHSSFNGTYYTKTDAQIPLCGQRPYYVWFFGNQSLLAGVRRAIERELKERDAKTYVGAPGYAQAPYKTLKSTHPYHYENARANFNGTWTFSFLADLSVFPETWKYLEEDDHYKTNREQYEISDIKENEQDNPGPYNTKFVVKVEGRKNDALTPGMVEISLKSPSSKVPKWVKETDDPQGEDYDHGYDPKLQRTFGLRSLIEGAAACYQQPYWATYRIKIN